MCRAQVVRFSLHHEILPLILELFQRLTLLADLLTDFYDGPVLPSVLFDEFSPSFFELHVLKIPLDYGHLFPNL